MTISKQAHAYLEQLVATGLYGEDVEQVMVRLIDEKLLQLLRDGVLHKPTPAPPKGPTCPACGSPRLAPLKCMGAAPDDVECQDCRNVFKP